MALFSSLLLPLQVVLSLALLFLIFSSLAQARKISEAGHLDRIDWSFVFGSFIAAAAIRLLLPPPLLIHTNFHALYFMENALGPKTSDLGELLGRAPYGMTNYSVFQLFWAYLPRTWPMYAALNALLAAAIVPLTVLLVRLMGGNRVWAIGAGLVLCLLPAHIKASPTESEITLSSLFAILTLVQWTAYLRSPGKLLLAGTVAALTLTVHSRVLVLAFPLILAAFCLYLGELKQPLKARQIWFAGAIWAALAWPQYAYIGHSLTVGDAAGEAGLLGEKLTLFLRPEANLLANFQVTPVLLALLVLVGLFLLAFKQGWRGLSLVGQYLFLSVLYHIHSAHFLDQLRYQFFLWPFVAIIAGYVLSLAKELPVSAKHKYGVGALVVVLLVAGLVRTLPFLTSVPPSSAEAAFVMSAVNNLPQGSTLLESPPLPTSSGKAIAPLAIPAFLLEETGRDLNAQIMTRAPSCSGDSPVVIYVGLQNYVVQKSNDCTGEGCFRLAPEINALGCRLVPIVATSLDTNGPSPGPDLEFRVPTATVGFYRLVKDSLRN
jgi:hypothetical protein